MAVAPASVSCAHMDSADREPSRRPEAPAAASCARPLPPPAVPAVRAGGVRCFRRAEGASNALQQWSGCSAGRFPSTPCSTPTTKRTAQPLALSGPPRRPENPPTPPPGLPILSTCDAGGDGSRLFQPCLSRDSVLRYPLRNVLGCVLRLCCSGAVRLPSLFPDFDQDRQRAGDGRCSERRPGGQELARPRCARRMFTSRASPWWRVRRGRARRVQCF